MKTKIVIIWMVLSIFSSCDKGGNWILSPVDNFLLRPRVNGTLLSEPQLMACRLYILDENGKKIYDPGEGLVGIDLDDSLYVYPVATEFNTTLINKGILYVIAAYILKPVPGTNKLENTCYLEFPDGKTDSIFITGLSLSDEEGAKERCYCTRPVKSVAINGKSLPSYYLDGVKYAIYYYDH